MDQPSIGPRARRRLTPMPRSEPAEVSVTSRRRVSVWRLSKSSDFDSGAELDNTLRRDQEVIRCGDGIAHHEGINSFLPQRHLGLQRGYRHLSPEEEGGGGRVASDLLGMRAQGCRDIRLFGEAEAQFHSPDTGRQLIDNNPGRLRYPWRALGR